MRPPFSRNSSRISLSDVAGADREPGFTSKASSAGGPAVNIFAPQYHDLLYNNLSQYASPKSRHMHNALMSQIYTYDTIAGPAVDLYSELPWSKFELTGINDRYVLNIYQQALDNLKLEHYLPMISTHWYVFGRVCLHLLFDQTSGVWSNLIVHDDNDIRVTPVPFVNEDPFVDLVPSKGLVDFANSVDPRTEIFKTYLSDEMMEAIKVGKAIPLDPANTLYLPRTRLAKDHMGTSIFSRILGLIVYERALFNASTLKAQRGAGNIRLVKLGRSGPDGWLPTDDQLNDLVSSLMMAEEDPVASVVGVKSQDVDIQTVAGAGKEAFWTVSEESEFIQGAKLKALGISEAMLNGDATYNNMEQALSIFLDKIRFFRDFMTRKVIVEKVLEPLAKVHGFHKKDNEGFKTTSSRMKKGAYNLTVDNISDSKLILPTIQWAKPLEPSMDASLIELYKTAEEVGIPISMRRWAIAMGSNLSELEAEAADDIPVRKRLAKLRAERDEAVGGSGDAANLNLDDLGEGGAGSGLDDLSVDSTKPSMEKVEQPSGGGSVIDSVPPPPGGDKTPSGPGNKPTVEPSSWRKHPLMSRSTFCGTSVALIEALEEQTDDQRNRFLQKMSTRDAAVAKYALTYMSSSISMTPAETSLVSRLMQEHPEKFKGSNSVHLANLYSNNSVDSLVG
jgi:hypothetical protein